MIVLLNIGDDSLVKHRDVDMDKHKEDNKAKIRLRTK